MIRVWPSMEGKTVWRLSRNHPGLAGTAGAWRFNRSGTGAGQYFDVAALLRGRFESPVEVRLDLHGCQRVVLVRDGAGGGRDK